MELQPTYRYRITFAKTEAMRFTGHLDLHRAWERTFRRADLPLAYDHGFTPHPRIQLGCALPLGFVGDGELMDAWLERPVAPDQMLSQLRGSAPPGILVHQVEAVSGAEPSLQQQVVEAEYEVDLMQGSPQAELGLRLAELLAHESLPRVRRGKPYDLRPLIVSAEAAFPQAAGPRLRLRLSARESATGRPDEVLAALGVDPSLADIRRTRLYLATS
ncbi:MAG: TIGR03936 family radical SAM-associated protein [Anaerolineales bacterium]|nr:TIGR03936 family radical SAM-associated protein [Anaerolineales bacterium]